MSKSQTRFKHPLTGEWVSQEQLHQYVLEAMIENKSGLLTANEVVSARKKLEERYGYRHHPSAT